MRVKMGALLIVLIGLFPGTVLSDSLISFTDDDLYNGIQLSLNADRNAQAWSWTQTVSASNVTVEAILTIAADIASVDYSAQAFLTTSIGPSTTAADVVASTTYTPPYIPTHSDLSSAPYTTLFTGLNLAPGTYYLVIGGPSSGYYFNYWLGGAENAGYSLYTAPGFTVNGYVIEALSGQPPWLDHFAPANNFGTITYYDDPVGFFRVSSGPIPEPTSLLFLGTGLAILWLGVNRRRKK